MLLRDRDEGLPEFTSMTGTLLDMRVYGDLYHASDTSPCPDVAACNITKDYDDTAVQVAPWPGSHSSSHPQHGTPTHPSSTTPNWSTTPYNKAVGILNSSQNKQ